MTIGEIVPKKPIVVETPGEPVIKVEPPQEDYEKKKRIIRTKQILWYVWLIIEVLLLMRFILKLLGANPDSFFNILITVITTPLVIIFNGLFPNFISLVGNAVIEWTTLFAMLFYAIVAFVVAWFYRIKKPIDPKEAEDKADQLLP